MTDATTIVELAHALRTGATTAEAVCDACLSVIARRGQETNAFITVLADGARAAARRADAEMAAGQHRGPLHGVPVSLKDIIDLEGVPTTAASRVRRDHVARAHAVVVTRLLDAGAVVIGKTNLHEFALGPTNDDSAYGPVRHPLDGRLSSGGSSGGSAVSVATGMAWASIGTDTGGSIRIPASLCGVVGLKPSMGEVPTTGVVPLSESFDHVGPLCRSVADARLLLEVLTGQPVTSGSGRHPRQGLRLGVPRAYFLDRLDSHVRSAFDAACEATRHEGTELQEVTVAHATDTAPVYVCVALAEAAEYHASTVETRPEDYTPGIRPRLQAGRYILAEDYLRAQRGRRLLTLEVDTALDGLDALILPTVPVPAQPVGAALAHIDGWEDSVRNTLLRLTQLFNVTGHPAITIPCGATPAGLPIGLQLVGPRGQTARLLDVAAAIEATLRRAGC